MNESRSFVTKIALLIVGSVGLWLMLFSFVSAESIRSFDAVIVVNADSSLTITETIGYDFGQVPKHGMYREVSSQHAQSASAWYKERYVEYELMSILRNGKPEAYSIGDSRGLSVKIGSADRSINGLHEYEIVYKAIGAIAEGVDGTELYWNVTGSAWDIPMANITATVVADGAILEPAQYCYAGRTDSNKKCTNISANPTNTVFLQDKLWPREEFTIAQSLSLPAPAAIAEGYNFLILEIILSGLLLIIAAIFLYRWYYRYRTSKTIIAQYEPLADFKPMFTGVLIDNKLDSRDITAGIVYLAQQGFISIRHVESKILYFFDHSDYEVTLLRSPSEAETAFQKSILGLLFDSRVVNQTVLLSSLRSDSAKLRKNGLALIQLRSEVKKDLVKTGYLEQPLYRASKGFGLGGSVLPFIIAGVFFVDFAPILIISLFVSIGLCTVALSERRTTKGYKALNYLRGFKDFLTVTDADRFAFHNAPGLSPQQFMEYLPYAIAFGVEKEWAEVFKDIHIDAPSWYVSNNQNSFGSLALTQNLGAFSRSFAGSTGSSGSRGSSGGGSSGGGSGGGGGGSW